MSDSSNKLARINKALSQGDDYAVTEGTSDDQSQIIPKVWAVYGKTYSPCEKVVDKLSPGHYMIMATPERGIFFSEKTVNMDELMILPDTESDAVVKGIETFWTKEEHYRTFKFLWKRGILLYGPPGSGKTSTVQIIANKIVERGGLAVYLTSPGLAINGLDVLRFIEPKRPVVVILEDIDAIIDKFGESELLALLDGEFQVDNAVFIATTNYPETLDKRIINRPSRFDIVKRIGMPSVAAREVYLSIKNPRLKANKELLDKWVKDTELFSIAHLKELIISIECLELPYEECLDRLRSMINDEKSSTENESGIKLGFGFK